MPRANLTNQRASAMVAKPIDLEAIYYLFRERIWLILLCEVLAAALAVAYASRARRVYEAGAVIQVEKTEPKVLKIESVIQENWQDEEMMKTIEQTLVSRPVLEAVIRTNN